MSKRTIVMDDKLLSEMMLKNIGQAAKKNLDLSTIFNDQQMQLMAAYKKIYNYPTNFTFFLTLGMMSHLSQNSYFTHYSSPDHRPVQLYLWLLGPSGMNYYQTFVFSFLNHVFISLFKAVAKRMDFVRWKNQ